MLKYFAILFIIISFFFQYSNFSIAQTDEDLIWSVAKVDPNITQEKLPDYYWVPVEQVPRFFDFATGITVEPNFRVHPTSNSTQSELSIDVHPTNSNIVFASANTTPWPVTTVWGTGVYWTLNGAASWSGADDPSTLSGFGSNSGDPASVIGTDGKFYENYISNSSGQGVAVSTNNGASWNTYTVAPNPGSLADKNHYMVDKKSGSNYENRSYCAWTDFGGANNYNAVLRYSTNFGQTWSSSINLSSSLSSYLNQGVNIQTGPSGEVYATWAVYIDGSVSTGEDGIGFANSTNGGVTWSAPSYAYQATNFGIRGYLSSKNSIRVSSFPSMAVDRSGGPNNGNIYITWTQRGVSPAGSDPDIVLVKSIDGGTNWSSPVRVNDDPLNNGKDQYYSWCTVDQSTGQLMLIFYDSRDVANNQANVYMATSYDGGNTFENFKVSDQAHTPSPISGLAGGYAGDYIGVASLNDIAYPFWADNRTGNYQGWMSVVTFGPPCPIDPPSNPNPANVTIDVPISLTQLTWTNGAGATENELWFGEMGNMQLIHSGTLVSSYTIPAPLSYSTGYQWQVIEQNDTCDVNGPVWSFTTEDDPSIVTATVFFDDFESGLGQWTVTNNGGTCVWEIFTPPYLNSYTLPATSSGGLLAADSDECGSGTTFLSTATIVPILDLSSYTDEVWVEFDNDWNIYDSADEAHVEVSTNGGSTWVGVWDNIGSDIRNTHEVIDVTTLLGGQSNVRVRVRTVQPGFDWWWVLDNFAVYGQLRLPSVVDPTGVTATGVSYSQIDIGFTTNIANDNVVVVWNLSGAFTDPAGTPPVVGQPFAGGTLLYNGTTSPVNHTGLTQLTTYYYKAFSYDGANYSLGVTVSATTSSALNFGVDFLVSDNCTNSVLLKFGTAPGATDCYDAGLDQSAPPPPPVGAFDGRFNSCGEPWFTDIRGTNLSGERIWVTTYTPATGCSPVSFSWNPSQLPVDGYFHLVDPIYGNLVNVNMRTSSTYTDVFGYGQLLIKYNYQINSKYNVTTGWNMLSLPVDVADNNYLTMFPNAVPGTLYGYSGMYFSTTTIENCGGYWLKFPVAEVADIYGSDRTECVVALSAGWNMIGGPNCNVPLSSVIDPGGIIVPGTLNGYSGSYINASSIDGTKGYWIKTSAAGTITISCSSPPANSVSDDIYSPESLADFGMINITDASETSQQLYFSGNLSDDKNIESYSMPPVPPPGSFDARLVGDYRLAESDEASIQLQATEYPVSIVITKLNSNEEYVLVEMANGLEVGTQKIAEGSEIIIRNKEVTILKITKEQSLPTTYNLEQNYPNPFNPSTTIKFSLPEAANATLRIYNTLGQKVDELVNTNLEAGWYNYQWNATNIATGIYIYELRTDKFISVKKMILMK